MTCSSEGCRSTGSVVECSDCLKPFCVAHVLTCARCLQGNMGTLPSDGEPRLKALLETLRRAMQQTADTSKKEGAREDEAAVVRILEDGETGRFGKHKITPVVGVKERLQSTSQRLSRTLRFDDEDENELAPVWKIVEKAVEKH